MAKKISMLAAAGNWKKRLSIKNPVTIKKIKAMKMDNTAVK